MAKRKEWTERRKQRFLSVLRETANASAAARKSGLPRSSAYALRATDEEFSSAWDDVMESILDDLEAELCRRAIEGTEKPVYYGGREVGSVRSYNDSAAMFLLRSRRPFTYGGRAMKLLAGEGADPSAGQAEGTRQKLEEKLGGLEAAGDGADD